MYTLKYILEEIEPLPRTRAKINALVRDGLVQLGHYWTIKYLPLHFEQRAYQRYGYRPRTQNYDAMKRRFARNGTFRWPKGGPMFVAERPIKPNVLTGRMRQQLLDDKTQYHPRAYKKHGAGGFELRVPIPFRGYEGRPTGAINPNHKGELGALNETEIREMNRIMIEYVRPQITQWVRGFGGLEQRAQQGGVIRAWKQLDAVRRQQRKAVKAATGVIDAGPGIPLAG